MKRLLSGLAVVVAAATLSGCYYDPGYSYVRSHGAGGDAYYGQRTTVYDDGYYATPGYYDGGYYGNSYYGGGYYGYAPGVSVGISSGWYGGSGYRDGDRGRRDEGRGHWQQGHEGQWEGGGHDGGHGGGRGGRDNGHQGGQDNRHPGGHDGGHRRGKDHAGGDDHQNQRR